MRKIRHLFSVLLTIVICLPLYTQTAKSVINPDEFNNEFLTKLIVEKINENRYARKADSLIYHKVFNDAANNQAEWMVLNKKEDISQPENSKMQTTVLRISSFGGTKHNRVSENVRAVKYARGKTVFTYKKVVSEIFKKWKKKKDVQNAMKYTGFVYGGLGLVLDEEQKKIYVSLIMAERRSLNEGIAHKKSISPSFSKKRYGLTPKDDVACEDCKGYKYFNRLQEGLYVKNGKVYMKYYDINHVLDILTDAKDGFAIDVVQKQQYQCGKPNIYDNNLLSKGIVVKPLYQPKLIKKNTGTEDELDVMIGKFPKKVTGEYEMNLLTIKNKSICNVTKRSFLEIKDEKSKQSLEILPDTIEILPDTLVPPGQERYKVGYEDKTITFKIPFEYSKYNYKPKDIQPFLEAMGEPHFIIHKLTIYAHSSLEGDSAVNARLRAQRAKSIVKAMEDFQNRGIGESIVFDDSWEMFKEQIIGTQFADLGMKSKEEVRKVFRTNRKVRRSIEPLLDEERFGRIVMYVTVDDIQGMSEEGYLTKKVSDAIQEDDYTLALKTQRFIIENVINNKYRYQAILEQEFPYRQEYASLIINQIWARNRFEGKGLFTPELSAEFDGLYALAPENPYARYNKLLCTIKKQEFTTQNDMDSIQVMIDALYSTIIPAREINKINIKFQFSILDWYEKQAKLNKIALAKSINKIRKCFKPEDADWRLALKVANLYGQHRYFRQALEALEPFIALVDMDSEDINEELLFTYIIISSQKGSDNHSKSFRNALHNASKINKSRYCRLFGAPYLSYQLLDDPIIKNMYCTTCDGEEDEGEDEAFEEDENGVE